VEGFLVFDKPPGITSHDVVAMLRGVLGIRKIGHTGTLDPFATGVLAIAVGSATRLIQYLDEDLKVYDSLLQLGQATDTGDPEGDIIETAPVPELDDAHIQQVLDGFVGDRMQTPPMYSAVKINGRPLYSYARAGETVEVPARPIRVDEVSFLGWQAPHLRVRITCGKGTYARVLAEDFGQALGSVAHLIGLRRERSGPFTLEHALDAPTLSQIAAGTEDWKAALRPARGEERVPWNPRHEVRAAIAPRIVSCLAAVSHLPLTQLQPHEVKQVRSGGRPPPPPAPLAAGERYALAEGEQLVAIATVTASGGQLARVLPPSAD
jgi:tRNA pseudouridine55 synthase